MATAAQRLTARPATRPVVGRNAAVASGQRVAQGVGEGGIAGSTASFATGHRTSCGLCCESVHAPCSKRACQSGQRCRGSRCAQAYCEASRTQSGRAWMISCARAAAGQHATAEGSGGAASGPRTTARAAGGAVKEANLVSKFRKVAEAICGAASGSEFDKEL